MPVVRCHPMLNRRFSIKSWAAMAVAVLLLINGGFAFFGAVWVFLGAVPCDTSCATQIAFVLAWGTLGVASAVLLFKRYLVGLWGGCAFLLLQTVGVATREFVYNPNSGLTLFFSISEETSAISFNILAIAAITVLISVFVRDHQAQEGLNLSDST